MRVFSARPEQIGDLPAKPIRYRSPAANMAFGALLGAVAGVLSAALLVSIGGFGVVPSLAVLLAVAVGGGLVRLRFGHGLGGALYRLDAAFRQGQAVMVIELDEAQASAVEHGIASRHPEVAVLGTDIEGTPPFP
jgi:hypothetical protein